MTSEPKTNNLLVQNTLDQLRSGHGPTIEAAATLVGTVTQVQGYLVEYQVARDAGQPDRVTEQVGLIRISVDKAVEDFTDALTSPEGDENDDDTTDSGG
jgi:hypothetical protein